MCDSFSLSKASYEDCYGLKVSLPIEEYIRHPARDVNTVIINKNCISLINRESNLY